MMGPARILFSDWGRACVAQSLAGRFRSRPPAERGAHVVLVVANHFEPTWNDRSRADGLRLLEAWCRDLESLGVKDGDGHPFKHTYFFPAEQYHPDLLRPLAEHCAAGFGEVEVHIHHGLDEPDTADALESALTRFVEQLEGHGCLARDRRTGRVGYSFVHGNWALANSAGGENCGVDNEMEILRRTGCYLDCTMPSAPDSAQVAVINSIYACGRPLTERAPHRVARPIVAGGGEPEFPFLLQGPLLLSWNRRIAGIPVPRLETGELSAEFPPSLERLRLWVRAGIHVPGQPAWIFVKLHTHGLVERHATALLGDPMKRLLEDLGRADDLAGRRVHFATAREAGNMILAAAVGETGDPGDYRDYRFVRGQ